MIVVLYPQFHRVGGIARYLDAFLSNLPTGSPEVLLVTGEAPAHGWERPGVRCISIPAPANRLGLVIWSWKAARLVARLAREGELQAVNLHVPPLIPGLFMPADVNLVLTAHTTYLGMSGMFEDNLNFRSPWSPLVVRIKMLMERLLIARAQTVVTLTEQGRQELARYGRTRGVEVVPNGVDLAEFTQLRGVDKDIDVIFCGRIERRKGSRTMVDVCRGLVESDPRVRIAVVGFGDDEVHVWRALAPLGDNVLLTGKVSFGDMVSYYARSKLYASTSYYEGLPGTCLEAMAMELPPVVWDRGFYGQLVVPGVTGLTVPVNDCRAMVARIRELLAHHDLRLSMGTNARALVAERYDWRRLAARLVEIDSRATRSPATTKEATT